MKSLRLVLAFLICIPLGAYAGAMTWYHTGGGNLVIEMIVGGCIGLFFGLIFGGNPDWKIWDSIFGPKEEEEK